MIPPCRTRVIVALVVVAVTAACADAPSQPDGAPVRPMSSSPVTAVRLALVGGDQQVGALGQALGEPLVVRVEDARGVPVPNVAVRWSASDPDDRIAQVEATSDSAGLVRTAWTLSEREGVHVLTVSGPSLDSLHLWAYGSALDLAAGTVVIDTSIVAIASDSVAQARGDYRFRSAAGYSLTLQRGQLIVSNVGRGFLRRVESVEHVDGALLVKTGEATLPDLVRGGFSATMPLFQERAPEIAALRPGAPRWTAPRVTFLSPGATALGGSVTLPGLDLCARICPAGVSLTVSGTFGFAPDLALDYGTRFGIPPVTLSAIASGTLTSDLDVVAQATVPLLVSGQAEVARFTQYIPIGVLVFEVRESFAVGFSGIAGPFGRASSGVQTTHGVQVGATYDGSWHPVLSRTEQWRAKPFAWDGQADAELRVYVRPKLEIFLYGLAGPGFGVEPYAKAVATAALPNWRYDLYAGVDAFFDLQAKLLGFTLARAQWNLPGTSTLVASQAGSFGGLLQLQTTTAGPEPDANGYDLLLDGTSIGRLSANALRSVLMAPGTHQLEFRDIAPNCAIRGDNPRQVTIGGGETLNLTAAFDCVATTGQVLVVITSTGPIPDPDGYDILVGERWVRTSRPADSILVGTVAPGRTRVQLSGMAAHCGWVTPSNTQYATVVAGVTSRLAFVVNCSTASMLLQLTTLASEVRRLEGTGALTPADRATLLSYLEQAMRALKGGVEWRAKAQLWLYRLQFEEYAARGSMLPAEVQRQLLFVDRVMVPLRLAIVPPPKELLQYLIVGTEINGRLGRLPPAWPAMVDGLRQTDMLIPLYNGLAREGLMEFLKFLVSPSPVPDALLIQYTKLTMAGVS